MPKITGEIREDLINIVKAIGVAVKTEIHTLELKDVYRLNNNRYPQTGAPITAEFISTVTKDKLLRDVKKYNRVNKTNAKLPY